MLRAARLGRQAAPGFRGCAGSRTAGGPRLLSAAGSSAQPRELGLLRTGTARCAALGRNSVRKRHGEHPSPRMWTAWAAKARAVTGCPGCASASCLAHQLGNPGLGSNDGVREAPGRALGRKPPPGAESPPRARRRRHAGPGVAVETRRAAPGAREGPSSPGQRGSARPAARPSPSVRAALYPALSPGRPSACKLPGRRRKIQGRQG